MLVYEKDLRRYVIELDENVGYYIYVYQGEKMIYDYLQDTLAIAKDFAEEKFGVPANAWKEAS